MHLFRDEGSGPEQTGIRPETISSAGATNEPPPETQSPGRHDMSDFRDKTTDRGDTTEEGASVTEPWPLGE